LSFVAALVCSTLRILSNASKTLCLKKTFVLPSCIPIFVESAEVAPRLGLEGTGFAGASFSYGLYLVLTGTVEGGFSKKLNWLPLSDFFCHDGDGVVDRYVYDFALAEGGGV